MHPLVIKRSPDMTFLMYLDVMMLQE